MEAVIAAIDGWLSNFSPDKSPEDNESALVSQLPGGSTLPVAVASRAVDLLEQLQQTVPQRADQETAVEHAKEGLISIPLNDMKSVSLLLKLSTVYGLRATAPRDLVLPYAENTAWKPVGQPVPNPEQFKSLSERLGSLVARKDDLADVLRINPYMTDVLAAAIALEAPEPLESVMGSMSTYNLYTSLMQLLSTNQSPQRRAMFAHTLAVMPLLRQDAMRSVIELLSGYRESDTVSLDRLDQLVNLVPAIPKNVPPREYLDAVSRQLYLLLGTITTPAEIVGVTLAMLTELDVKKPSSLSLLRDMVVAPFQAPEDPDLELSLMFLTNLSKKPSRFFAFLSNDVFFSVWLLFVVLTSNDKANAAILTLLSAICNSDVSIPTKIVQSLLSEQFQGLKPQIDATDGSLAKFVPINDIEPLPTQSEKMAKIGPRLNLFMVLLQNLNGPIISSLFVSVLEHYTRDSRSLSTDPLRMLVDLKLIERIAEELKPKLFTEPKEILDLALGIIGNAANAIKNPVNILEPTGVASVDSDDEEGESNEPSLIGNDTDLVEVGLGLLGGILLELPADSPLLKVAIDARPNIATLDQLKFLKAKVAYTLNLIDTVSAGKQVDLEDVAMDANDPQDVLRVANESLVDPLVPIRAHGISLLTRLLVNKESSVDLRQVLSTLIGQLKDEDSYIYLNAIRGIELAADALGTNVVISIIIPQYSSNSDLDFALRIGEALTRILRGSAKVVTPDNATTLVNVFANLVASNGTDPRLVSSAISLAALFMSESPVGFKDAQVNELVSACSHILKTETTESMAFLRRSSVVFLLELGNAMHDGHFENLVEYVSSQVRLPLQFASEEDADQTVKEYAISTMALYQAS